MKKFKEKFKEKFKTKGEKIKLYWNPCTEIPEDIHITKVYSLCFTKYGSVAMIKTNGEKHFTLPGGNKKRKESSIDTAVRENYEEATIKTVDHTLLGYIQVIHSGKSYSYSEYVLMYEANILSIEEHTPDPSKDKLRQRLFPSPKYVNYHLGWGKVGKEIVEAAVKRYNDPMSKNLFKKYAQNSIDAKLFTI